ncbi:hypothetical protein M0R45_016553 [Rubus argutus]|uniref:Uncharacterized protein n=1 Tax=Rubus argutus TaxID=59490 RepID=A0AAW1XWJ7_RUBAR
MGLRAAAMIGDGGTAEAEATGNAGDWQRQRSRQRDRRWCGAAREVQGLGFFPSLWAVSFFLFHLCTRDGIGLVAGKGSARACSQGGEATGSVICGGRIGSARQRRL